MPFAPASQTVTIIAALSENRVIGRGGGLPWHLPADLKRFKKLTLGHPVIMGRRTFDSIKRPLPDRTNIVVTRDASFTAEGVVVAHGLDEALAQAGDGLVFVAGGAEIYGLALSRADRLELTVVHARVDGDVRFPAFDPRDWQCTADERHEVDERHAYAFSFRTYARCAVGATA
ncbi:MAG: dihydrofolate reductase [Phycisphaerales bacterium]|nr:dihydrofolate reductase [Phycisphaerae bacterium]NNF42596.1 dihydrofolate reductase [Phycisphaerales bacterium]NNM26397.1 dihydrofolate reductase [Phycisphaerales bacterium]